jgi:DNA-binding NtrC family response regulator
MNIAPIIKNNNVEEDYKLTKILVADDDKLIRWSLKEIFSLEGYSVDTAASSLEAVQQTEKETYSLIFTDIEMDEENGISTIVKMNAQQPGIKIVILTALPIQQVEAQLDGINICAVLEKPFMPEDILAIAKKALAS